jgi:glycerophosphoryl diester phosphodiesterase
MTPSSPTVAESIILHRGASAYAPENTLPAVTLCARAHVRWVETDVRLTADNRLVMIHDDKLDRTTNGRGLVSLHNLEQIRELDAGGWLGPEYQGIQVPTLEEFLDCTIENELNLQVELKEMAGRESELVEAVVTTLKERWPFGKLDLLLSGFSERCLRQLGDLLPDIPRCLALEFVPVDSDKRAREAGVSIIQVQDKCVSDLDLDLIAASPVEYGVAVVNDPERARYLLSRGVQSVLTDRPELLDGGGA